MPLKYICGVFQIIFVNQLNQKYPSVVIDCKFVELSVYLDSTLPTLLTACCSFKHRQLRINRIMGALAESFQPIAFFSNTFHQLTHLSQAFRQHTWS